MTIDLTRLVFGDDGITLLNEDTREKVKVTPFEAPKFFLSDTKFPTRQLMMRFAKTDGADAYMEGKEEMGYTAIQFYNII